MNDTFWLKEQRSTDEELILPTYNDMKKNDCKEMEINSP